jgi:hypothetical protein
MALFSGSWREPPPPVSGTDRLGSRVTRIHSPLVGLPTAPTVPQRDHELDTVR